MPLITTRSFRVRYYECDAYGHLNNANYVRYMQEAAFDGSAAAGYSRETYHAMNRVWYIRTTEIDYLKPAKYGERIVVKTWVADIRRATSRRMYELFTEESGEPVARGFSDWVFMDTDSGRPAAVPVEVQRGFFPEGLPEKFPAREPFPQMPEPPSNVFTTRLEVAWRDIDLAGHVNNAIYFSYMEEAGMKVIAAHHWPVERLTQAGFAILLRKHQVQYLEPALMGDELEIATWVSGVRRSSALRHYTIRRVKDGTLLVRAHTLGAWVDLKSGRLIRIPEEMLADFRPNITGG